MPYHGPRLWLMTALLLAPHTYAESSAHITPGPSSASSRTARSTCSSTTINYLTDYLPQKCLKTGWTAPSSTSTSVEIGASTVVTQTVQTSGAVSGVSAASVDSRNASASAHGIGSSYGSSAAEAAEPSSQPDADLDSPLDDAKFLSFEEWKKQNLAKTENAIEEKIQARGAEGQSQDGDQPGFDNALDSMGDEGKIDIDISGFGGVVKPAEHHTSSQTEAKTDSSGTSETDNKPKASALSNLPKDAGKTHSERGNHASVDCGAKILKTNPKCKHSTSVLFENKDSYMLNECAIDNKFFIVQLCDQILIDTIVLANFEFFSSIFRTFRISVSNKYPVRIDKWITLGTYEARNSREIQAFLVENAVWARYLRVEFLTHYGSEYYCPLSLLRVHGMDEREDLRRSLNNEQEDDDIEEAVVEVPKEKAIAPLKETAVAEVTDIASDVKVRNDLVVLPTEDPLSPNNNRPTKRLRPANRNDTSSPRLSQLWSFAMNTTMGGEANGAVEVCPANHTSVRPPSSASPSVANHTPSLVDNEVRESTSSSQHVAPQPSPTNSTTSNSIPSEQRPLQGMESANTTTVQSSTLSPSSTQTISSTPTSQSSTSPSSASYTQSPPSSQDSFFKSTNKRLLALESSATLSLQYIESQSHLLRSAFNTVSSRQLNRTTAFLSTLNATVSAEMATFRSQYDQLWQSTVLELAAQKDDREREVRMLAARMELLAAELGSQRRASIAQTVLLVLCLAVVIFARVGGRAADVTLAQNVQSLVRGRSYRGSSSKQWASSPWASPPRPSSGWGDVETPSPPRRGKPETSVWSAHKDGPESPVPEDSPVHSFDLSGTGFNEDRPKSAPATPAVAVFDVGNEEIEAAVTSPPPSSPVRMAF